MRQCCASFHLESEGKVSCIKKLISTLIIWEGFKRRDGTSRKSRSEGTTNGSRHPPWKVTRCKRKREFQSSPRGLYLMKPQRDYEISRSEKGLGVGKWKNKDPPNRRRRRRGWTLSTVNDRTEAQPPTRKRGLLKEWLRSRSNKTRLCTFSLRKLLLNEGCYHASGVNANVKNEVQVWHPHRDPQIIIFNYEILHTVFDVLRDLYRILILHGILNLLLTFENYNLAHTWVNMERCKRELVFYEISETEGLSSTRVNKFKGAQMVIVMSSDVNSLSEFSWGILTVTYTTLSHTNRNDLVPYILSLL